MQPKVAKVNCDITFVKAGSAAKPRRSVRTHKVTSILDQARDWKVICDLRSERRSFHFPGMIAITTAEPDLVVYSLKNKICIIWELTAPMEENIEKRHKEKIDKYEKSIGHNLNKGWSLHIVAGEVGARGWVPPTFTKDLRRLFGFSKATRRKVADQCAEVARRCSFLIFQNRNNRDFERFLVEPS
jgi:hypothetical protein